MTIMYTEKAVIQRKRYFETKQYTKSLLLLKSSLQQIKLCDYPSMSRLVQTRLLSNAIMVVQKMGNMTVPATENAILMNELISSIFLRVQVMVGMMGLILEMLLNEKRAPERKKSISQGSKVFSILTPVNNYDRAFLVIMHFDIDTPSKYTEIARVGNIFHRQLQKSGIFRYGHSSKIFGKQCSLFVI